MALFSKSTGGDKGAAEIFPLPPRTASCSVCKEIRTFTKVWKRVLIMQRCPCCGLVFENPAALYNKIVPQCPRCEEPLEQPGFDYGLCDRCGSKHELIEGAKPSLLPNLRQRQEMNRFGKSRSVLD